MHPAGPQRLTDLTVDLPRPAVAAAAGPTRFLTEPVRLCDSVCACVCGASAVRSPARVGMKERGWGGKQAEGPGEEASRGPLSCAQAAVAPGTSGIRVSVRTRTRPPAVGGPVPGART